MSGTGGEFAELAGIIRGYQRSRAVTVAAELGIADLLRDGPRDVRDLARQIGSQEEALYRLLRALASIGVFHEGEQRRFSLTRMGELLRRDHPLSLDPLARMLGADYEWMLWGALRHSVTTGEVASHHVLGMDVWEYRRQHPVAGVVFDAAMRTVSSAFIPQVLGAYDFSRHRVVADIGGGTGAVLAHILAACPSTRGILFDQPQVVTEAHATFIEAGVHERIEVVQGNFFESVPRGADAYVLCHVLHDWMDPEATRILKSVRDAMNDEATLVVLDAVVGTPNTDSLVTFLDLMMMVSAGGRERTCEEWKGLFAAAGFWFERSTRVGPHIDVIEARPA